MTEPINLVAIIGSLRQESFNRTLFEATVGLCGPDVQLAEAPIRDVPLYNGDVEAAGDPLSVVQLRIAVEEADGLVVFTPEYNRGVPAVTKNAIDWLSRTRGDSVLARASVGIIAATPGGHDASGVRTHLSASIGANTKRFYEATLGISSIADKVSSGSFVDDTTRDQVATWIGNFADHTRAN